MRFEEIQEFLDQIPYNAEMKAASTVPERGLVIYEQSNYDSKILEEDSQPHIEAIFRLLVTQHPNYGEFQVDGNRLAWARKVHSKTRTIRLTYSPSFRYTVAKRKRSFHQRLKLLA